SRNRHVCRRDDQLAAGYFDITDGALRRLGEISPPFTVLGSETNLECVIRSDQGAVQGYPGKLRPSAAQISEFDAVSNRTICSWTSRTSEVENVEAGSWNTANWTCGVDEGDVVVEPESPHAAIPGASNNMRTARDAFMIPLWCGKHRETSR